MAVYGGPYIYSSNLASHFDATNSKSYPGNGSVWYNLAGFDSVNVSNINSYDNNISLNTRSRSFLVIPFNFNDNMTFEIWYRTYTPLNDGGIFNGSPPIMQIGNYNSNTSFTLWDVVTTSSRRVRTYVNNGNTWTAQLDSGTFTPEAWLRYHHIVMVFSGSNNWSNYKLYIDKNLITNYTIPNPTSSIGGGSNVVITGATGSQSTLDNSYSVVKIYHSALAISDIQQNYNALKGRFGL